MIRNTTLGTVFRFGVQSAKKTQKRRFIFLQVTMNFSVPQSTLAVAGSCNRKLTYCLSPWGCPTPDSCRSRDQRFCLDAAAVRAITSGSAHSTMSAISNRIARSESVSAPTSSATYPMGLGSRGVALWRLRWRVPSGGLPGCRLLVRRSSTSPARALRWPSMAARAALVLPRLAASSIAASIWPSADRGRRPIGLHVDAGCKGGVLHLERHGDAAAVADIGGPRAGHRRPRR
jgi:hypothetical protein